MPLTVTIYRELPRLHIRNRVPALRPDQKPRRLLLMRSRLLIAITAISVLAAAPAAAKAKVLDRLYAPLHLLASVAASPSFVRSHFPTTTVENAQLKKGYRS